MKHFTNNKYSVQKDVLAAHNKLREKSTSCSEKNSLKLDKIMLSIITGNLDQFCHFILYFVIFFYHRLFCCVTLKYLLFISKVLHVYIYPFRYAFLKTNYYSKLVKKKKVNLV